MSAWAQEYLVKSAVRVTFHTPAWLAKNRPKNPGASVWNMHHKPISEKRVPKGGGKAGAPAAKKKRVGE
jgi:hypothetical protein